MVTSNTIKEFRHELLGRVRTVEHEGEVFFGAKDVCECLGITNPARTLRQEIDSEDIQRFRSATNGGNQTLVFVNEPALYQLIFTGRSEQARRFKKWVTHEVLPSIRKTGKYSLPPGIASVEEMDEIQRMVDQYLGNA